MLFKNLYLLSLSLMCGKGWAWSHSSRDTLQTGLDHEGPVLVACKLISCAETEHVNGKLTDFRNTVLDVGTITLGPFWPTPPPPGLMSLKMKRKRRNTLLIENPIFSLPS